MPFNASTGRSIRGGGGPYEAHRMIRLGEQRCDARLVGCADGSEGNQIVVLDHLCERLIEPSELCEELGRARCDAAERGRRRCEATPRRALDKGRRARDCRRRSLLPVRDVAGGGCSVLAVVIDVFKGQYGPDVEEICESFDAVRCGRGVVGSCVSESRRARSPLPISLPPSPCLPACRPACLPPRSGPHPCPQNAAFDPLWRAR
jgi:hypothetical protein